MPKQRRPKSEFHHIADHSGHMLQFEFVPSAKKPKELYAVWDGRRIAYRGKPGTPQAGTWVSMVPGYKVVDEDYPDRIVVTFNGKVVH
jgi:hypothetical protein